MSNEKLNDKLNDLSDDVLENVSGGISMLENHPLMDSLVDIVSSARPENDAISNNTPAGSAIAAGLNAAINKK